MPSTSCISRDGFDSYQFPICMHAFLFQTTFRVLPWKSNGRDSGSVKLNAPTFISILMFSGLRDNRRGQLNWEIIGRCLSEQRVTGSSPWVRHVRSTTCSQESGAHNIAKRHVVHREPIPCHPVNKLRRRTHEGRNDSCYGMGTSPAST